MEQKEKDKLLKAVWKKALGYSATETVEELSVEDGLPTVTKQRKTTKDVAPDISAAKFLMEELNSSLYDGMTYEELEAEKKRLLNLLKNTES